MFIKVSLMADAMAGTVQYPVAPDIYLYYNNIKTSYIMHMADALISPPVAAVAGAVSIGLVAVASRKVSRIEREDIVPMMGVLGAFVFAAQMINFSIPGTGSSGHIIGGVLLAALLGPWAAFLTLCSVLIVQCLVFADGGLMALGCNVINMAAMSCLVAFPLIYRPIVGRKGSGARIMTGAVVASVVGLELGALLVTAQTELSGVTALPTWQFLGFMLPIHLVIGACEGIATGLVLVFVYNYKPDMLYLKSHRDANDRHTGMSRRMRRVLLAFGCAAVVLAATFFIIASSNPDGLEWSIANVTGDTELAPASTPATAFMPDYDSTFAGIVGGIIVMVVLWALTSALFRLRRHNQARAHVK